MTQSLLVSFGIIAVFAVVEGAASRETNSPQRHFERMSDLNTMSFEELLSVKITLPSKRAESTFDAALA